VQTHEEIKPVKLLSVVPLRSSRKRRLCGPCCPTARRAKRTGFLEQDIPPDEVSQILGTRVGGDSRLRSWMITRPFLSSVFWSLEFGISGLRTMDFDFLYLVVHIYGVGRVAVVSEYLYCERNSLWLHGSRRLFMGGK
jgi:hypothetical protein